MTRVISRYSYIGFFFKWVHALTVLSIVLLFRKFGRRNLLLEAEFFTERYHGAGWLA